MPKLELLFLDENLLTVDTFILALRGIRNLHTLDLSHNMLTKVPNLSTEDFPDLTNLWLGFNNIRTITRADLRGMSFIRQLILKDNLIEEIEYDAFAECPNITVLDMDGSRLSTLPDLKYMPQMRNFHLNRGRLTELPADLCKSHRYLTILEVEENFLKSLPTFSACIPGLTIGEFAHNLISSLQNDTFANQGLLRRLNLEHNLITDLPDGLLDDAKNLADLRLSHNQLTSLSPQIFDELLSLVSLDASHNKIQSLDEGLFKNNTEMDILYLNNNRIERIDNDAFPNYSELRRLDLSDNPFRTWQLPSTGFIYLAHLALKNVPNLFHVPAKYQIPRVIELEYTYPYHCCIWRDFALEVVYHDDETLNSTDLPPTMIPTSEDPTLPPGWESCSPDEHRNREQLEALQKTWNFTVELLPDCKLEVHYHNKGGPDVEIGTSEQDEFAPLVDDVANGRGLGSNLDEETPVNFRRQVLCTPVPDALNPCENLMDPMFLRVAIWAIWVVALLGNGTVLFVAIGALEKLETYQFIICNLAIADFFMGIYLAFLAIVDIRTFGDESFFQSALSWQFGPGCKTAGFIAVFASELSMYMLVLLTVERVYTISYGFNQTEKSKMKIAAIFAVIGWIFALFLATLPLLGINSYTKVAVCLPYMTQNWYDRAYIGFLISINMVGFLVILLSYCYIFYRIRKSPAQPPTKTGTIATAAMKIAVLIVSALVCWAPIAVIGYSALAGKPLVSVYQAKFFIVFVYPVNACINPFIYAIFTRHFRTKLGSMFKRTKDKVTSFPPHSLRLQHRNNAFMTDNSCGRVNSPRGHLSPEELRRLRQSRRSNSYCLHYVAPTSAAAVVQSPSPTTRISPPAGVYMGRRSSLPAAFGSTLGAGTPSHARVATNATVYPPLPFQLGPMYTGENSSLPNLPEESEMKDMMPPAHIEVERATLGGSQDSSLRRLSIVEEEEEVDETEMNSKGVELESVSVSSSDSEEYIEAREHPIDVVVIEKCTDLDAAAAIVTHREEKSKKKKTKRSEEAGLSHPDFDSSTPHSHKSQRSKKRTPSASSLSNVVVEELTELSEAKLESLERRLRAERGASKLSTDSACSGYISSAVDDALAVYTPDEGRGSTESSDGAQRSASPEEIDGNESENCRRKTSSCFEDARSQPTLGDTTSVDSGSCHDVESNEDEVKKQHDKQTHSYLPTTDQRTDSNTPTGHYPSGSSVVQESVHSTQSRSHSSKSHAQTGFSNLTFDLQTDIVVRNDDGSVRHSTERLGVTKSETEV